MFMWLSSNLINIALAAVILLIVGLSIFVMVRNKRAGKSSCGCSCSGCASCGGCSACGRRSGERS